ncbi:hypothetical protein Dda_4078 [Drechslerella dactyloides]|uniref:DUF6594 domain-containing protein n=1 Tax=Drechslerella dactyloides TaxID=74499 RepID=A0AAD6IZ37_DREDA|nr:hypothetical protein Dda_4078 [Drechslerella dactyloides]
MAQNMDDLEKGILPVDSLKGYTLEHHRYNLVCEIEQPELTVVDKIYGKLSGSTPGGPRGLRFRISFAEMQRMYIRELQSLLVQDAIQLYTYGKSEDNLKNKRWQTNLAAYVKALQDYDYMESHSKSNRDPFLATGEYAVDNFIINENIKPVIEDFQAVRANGMTKYPTTIALQTDASKDATVAITGTRGTTSLAKKYKAFRRRLVFGIFGGGFLVGPMWLMLLTPGLYNSLISATSFIAGFGLIMACFLTEATDVLAMTAAYAAVLVVFVGTNTAS